MMMIGFLGSCGHMLLTTAYKIADISAVEPVVFARLVWAAIVGWFLFAEFPGIWVWVGGALIVNRPGRAREQIGSDVAAGLADIEALGVMALANPDLVHRLKTGAPFNEVRTALFYAGGGAEGYTDYPFTDQA